MATRIEMVEDGTGGSVRVTGYLHEARRDETWFGKKQPILVGKLHGDAKGRFRDGEVVHTSMIVRELPGDVFQTKNSVYRVMSWAPESKENSA